MKASASTPEELVAVLTDEIRRLSGGVSFYDANGDVADLHVFSQTLPQPQSNTEDSDITEENGLLQTNETDTEFPYCVVRIDNVKVTGITTKRTVDIILELGIFYEKEDCQYQHSMLTLFEKIQRRFLINPVIGAAECEPEMVFAVSPNDEDTHPYYFGGAALRFLIPTYEREDMNA